MRTSRITDDMSTRIPVLLIGGMTQAEIAAIYGVTPGTLVVLCSQRGISLRRGGRIASEDLYKAVLDEEAA